VADHHRKGPDGEPVPRDLPDQLAREGEDPWDAAPGTADEDDTDTGTDTDVPDTDEAGTGRQGAPRSATVHPEHPVPDEPTG
jgi:hypothetical protein